MLIKRTDYEDRTAKVSWVLIENGKVLRERPFIDRAVALGFYEEFKEQNETQQ